MTQKPSTRSSALRGVALATFLAFTFTLPLGCSSLNMFRSKLPQVPNLPSAPAVSLSPETMALVQTMGPVALVAMSAVVDAIAKNMAERRAAEAAEDERQRVKMAAAELFYADACTQGAAAEAKPRGDLGESAKAELQAEQAFAQGDFAAAAKALQSAREAQVKATGETSAEVARLYNREATVHLATGNFAAAIAPALKGHQLREERLSGVTKANSEKSAVMVASLDVAESQSTLGQIYLGAGVLDQANTSLDGALEQRTSALGQDHLCVAASQNSLGEFKQTVGAFAEGFDLFRKSLATRKGRLPADHRDLAQSHNNVGICLPRYGLIRACREQLQGSSRDSHEARRLNIPT
jgi:hypothetical protein